ncbi:hypothetical protein QJS66_05835 [Kocuria rhizophila]|nr:hypothetical protein QJS66_05835 [Kocuria rhizophila]
MDEGVPADHRGTVRRIREPWRTRIAAWRKLGDLAPADTGGGPRTPIRGAAHGACWARGDTVALHTHV